MLVVLGLVMPAVGALFAQVESDERPLEISPNGIAFHKDSVFLMNMRFRMQNRFGYLSSLDGDEKGGFEAMVRRLRLWFDGFVLSPKIGYYIQLSFSRSDQYLSTGTIAQTVRASNFKISNIKFDILSMGMSGDYTIAIQEGSNMVRIGSLLFGNRS